MLANAKRYSIPVKTEDGPAPVYFGRKYQLSTEVADGGPYIGALVKVVEGIARFPLYRLSFGDGTLLDFKKDLITRVADEVEVSPKAPKLHPSTAARGRCYSTVEHRTQSDGS